MLEDGSVNVIENRLKLETVSEDGRDETASSSGTSDYSGEEVNRGQIWERRLSPEDDGDGWRRQTEDSPPYCDENR